MSTWTLSFWLRCFWSIIKSLSIVGYLNLMKADAIKKIRRPIADTEIHAPEIVP